VQATLVPFVRPKPPGRRRSGRAVRHAIATPRFEESFHLQPRTRLGARNRCGASAERRKPFRRGKMPALCRDAATPRLMERENHGNAVG
jgi:hypothetical protein